MCIHMTIFFWLIYGAYVNGIVLLVAQGVASSDVNGEAACQRPAQWCTL